MNRNWQFSGRSIQYSDRLGKFVCRLWFGPSADGKNPRTEIYAYATDKKALSHWAFEVQTKYPHNSWRGFAHA